MLHDPVDYTVIGVGPLFCAIHVSDLFDSGGRVWEVWFYRGRPELSL